MLSHKRNAKTRDAKTRDAKTRDSNSHKNNRTKWKANWKLTDFFHLHATENRSILLQFQFPINPSATWIDDNDRLVECPRDLPCFSFIDDFSSVHGEIKYGRLTKPFVVWRKMTYLKIKTFPWRKVVERGVRTGFLAVLTEGVASLKLFQGIVIVIK